MQVQNWTCLFHKRILRGELGPSCNTHLTVRHVFLKCVTYAHINRTDLSFISLFELFRDTPAGIIIHHLWGYNPYKMF